jgi:hypothetical protein
VRSDTVPGAAICWKYTDVISCARERNDLRMMRLFPCPGDTVASECLSGVVVRYGRRRTLPSELSIQR